MTNTHSFAMTSSQIPPCTNQNSMYGATFQPASSYLDINAIPPATSLDGAWYYSVENLTRANGCGDTNVFALSTGSPYGSLAASAPPSISSPASIPNTDISLDGLSPPTHYHYASPPITKFEDGRLDSWTSNNMWDVSSTSSHHSRSQAATVDGQSPIRPVSSSNPMSVLTPCTKVESQSADVTPRHKWSWEQTTVGEANPGSGATISSKTKKDKTRVLQPMPSHGQPDKRLHHPTNQRHWRSLEVNRVAALKCRAKRRDWIQALESTASALEKEHKTNLIVHGNLVKQVARLKNLLLYHAMCRDKNIQCWIECESMNNTRRAQRGHFYEINN